MGVELFRGRARGPHWVHLARGAHRRAVADEDVHGWLADLLAWQLVLAEEVCFAHLTAARVWELKLPPLPARLPVFVSSTGAGRVRRRGLVVVRHRAERSRVTAERLGLRVVSVPECLLACARDLHLLDLVVLIDSALHLERCLREELVELAASRRPGAVRLRRALALADGRSESVWETLLRLLHVVCEIEVEPQYELRDADGAFVARADLLLVGTRRLHEYDGADHLNRRRQRRDLKRLAAIECAEHTRRGYVKEDVVHQGIVILRDADEAIGRPHDPSRIRRWHNLLRHSLFTDAGEAALMAGWERRAAGRSRVDVTGPHSESGPLVPDAGPEQRRKDHLGGIC